MAELPSFEIPPAFVANASRSDGGAAVEPVGRARRNALWCTEDAERLDRPLTGEDREWITRAVTIAKDVQD